MNIMLYYSYDLYMNWYNWYYNVAPKKEEVEKEVEECNCLNEAIGGSINDPPPPHKANKKKKKKNKK